MGEDLIGEKMADIMTAGYLMKLKVEMKGRLGCGIEVVEDRDSSYPGQARHDRTAVQKDLRERARHA